MADADVSSNDTTGSEEQPLEDSDMFIVEKIMDKRKSQNGITIYRVRWEGYGPLDDTWEPIENLENCKSLVEQFDRERSGKKRKRGKHNHGSFTLGPPPPLRDGDFWQRADEGKLEIEKDTIYEKVKKHKRLSHENESSSSKNFFKSNSDVFAADSEENSEDDVLEGTISPPLGSPAPKKDKKSKKRRKSEDETSKMQKIGDTVSNILNTVVHQRPKTDLERSESATVMAIMGDESPKVRLQIEKIDESPPLKTEKVSSSSKKHSSEKPERNRIKSDKNVSFADDKDEKKKKIKVKKPSSHGDAVVKERQSTKTAHSDSAKVVKKIVECPINWTANAEKSNVGDNFQKPKAKSKAPKKFLLTTPPPLPPLTFDQVQEVIQSTLIAGNSTSSSPDCIVDIGLDTNGSDTSGSLDNLAPEGGSPNSDSVQRIEILEKSFSDALERLDKQGNQKKSFLRLKRLYEDVQKQIDRTKNFIQPVTYLPSDEEKSSNWQKLTSAIERHDLSAVEQMLMEYRACELGLDDLNGSGGKSLLMICSLVKCKQDHALCKIIRLLIQSGADPNKSLPNGETALMMAARMGHLCKIKRLLSLGAKIDSVNDLGETALFYTIRKCPEETAAATVKLLLGFGVDYCLENKNNATALRIAEHYKKPHLIAAINNHVTKLENDFTRYLESMNNSIEILDKMLNLRSLQVKTDGSWTFNFNVKELVLPEGFGVCLFLSLAEFDETGAKFLSNENIPVKEVFLNEKVLSSLTNGSMDVLWLEPIQYGSNSLVVSMSESKHNLAKLIVQANIIRVTGSLTDDSGISVERTNG